jgi:hypothetical protein
MITVTPAEIAQFRSELSTYPDALVALDAIEDCEGDLEDAAIVLALHAGQEPDTSERWLESVAKRCRAVICQKDFKEELLQGKLNNLVGHLATTSYCPKILVTPVVLYVAKQGVDEFCQVLNGDA